jgi:hypothetical protein
MLAHASLEVLGLSRDLNEEVPLAPSIINAANHFLQQEKSARLGSLITSAVNEDNAEYSLNQIYDAIITSGSASLLVRIVYSVTIYIYISL